MLESGIDQWCNICNAAPSEGTLTVVIEGQETNIQACTECVNDPELVAFV